jgi:hypothetical protein
VSLIRKEDLVNMKALANPPIPVKMVSKCIMILKPIGNENEADDWGGARIMMSDPGKLLTKLKEFPDKIGDVKSSQIQKIERIVKDPANKFADMD